MLRKTVERVVEFENWPQSVKCKKRFEERFQTRETLHFKTERRMVALLFPEFGDDSARYVRVRGYILRM